MSQVGQIVMRCDVMDQIKQAGFARIVPTNDEIDWQELLESRGSITKTLIIPDFQADVPEIIFYVLNRHCEDYSLEQLGQSHPPPFAQTPHTIF